MRHFIQRITLPKSFNRPTGVLMFVLVLMAVDLIAAQHLYGQVTPDDNGIVYVKPEAEGDENGKSWGNATDDLQSAIDAPNVQQVWVAAGVYTPGDGSNREAVFQLKSGVEVYGGFEGNEGSLSERDWKLHITVLSGDIDNNVDINDGGVVADVGDISGGNRIWGLVLALTLFGVYVYYSNKIKQLEQSIEEQPAMIRHRMSEPAKTCQVLYIR